MATLQTGYAGPRPILQDENAAAIPPGPWPNDKLETFIIAMFLNDCPRSAKQNLTFMRHLNKALSHYSSLAQTKDGLLLLQKLVAWNLTPILPYAPWALLIQELCKNIAVLNAHDPSKFFSARHKLTKGPRLPQWQANPAFDKYLGDGNGSVDPSPGRSPKLDLLIEYSKCVFETTRVLMFSTLKDYHFKPEPEAEDVATPSTKSKVPSETSSMMADTSSDSDAPDVTIHNSPDILIFEAFTIVMETSYLIRDQLPWAADQLMAVAIPAITKTSLADMYPRRLQAVIERMEEPPGNRRASQSGELRATAPEFSPGPKTSRRSSAVSIVQPTVLPVTPARKKRSWRRRPSVHVDEFEARERRGSMT